MKATTGDNRVEVFLRKDVNSMAKEDCTEKDISMTRIPDEEADLMLNELNGTFAEQGLFFEEWELEIYKGEELKRAMEVISQYKDRLPVLYTEVKKAYDLDTVAIVCL